MAHNGIDIDQIQEFVRILGSLRVGLGQVGGSDPDPLARELMQFCIPRRLVW